LIESYYHCGIRSLVESGRQAPILLERLAFKSSINQVWVADPTDTI
jgi:hypothetical protein